MEQIILKVPSISCGHCVHTIKMELMEQEGIKEVTADLETKSVSVSFELPATEARIKDLLKEINYPAAE